MKRQFNNKIFFLVLAVGLVIGVLIAKALPIHVGYIPYVALATAALSICAYSGVLSIIEHKEKIKKDNENNNSKENK